MNISSRYDRREMTASGSSVYFAMRDALCLPTVGRRYAIFHTMSAASEGEQRHRAESQGQRDKGSGKRIKELRKEVRRAFHECFIL